MISIAVSIHEYISSAGSVLPLSHLPPVFPINITYILLILLTLFLEKLTVEVSHIYVPNLMSISHGVCYSTEFFQVQGTT
jgi:hypothetical protein